MGFPITRYQVAVLGAAHVREWSPTPPAHAVQHAGLSPSGGRLDTASENNRGGNRRESDQSWRLGALVLDGAYVAGGPGPRLLSRDCTHDNATPDGGGDCFASHANDLDPLIGAEFLPNEGSTVGIAID